MYFKVKKYKKKKPNNILHGIDWVYLFFISFIFVFLFYIHEIES